MKCKVENRAGKVGKIEKLKQYFCGGKIKVFRKALGIEKD